MKPLLAPLVEHFDAVTFIGLCKNAGKTTALCRLLAEWQNYRLAVTSVGRDGERTDVVTGTEKPAIWVRKGTLFATARGLLPLCDVTTEVMSSTDVHTPLGQVAVFRALSDGYVQLAGPSAAGQLSPLAEAFRAFGAEKLLIDGAAGRKSLAAGVDGCALLCVGASMGTSVEQIAAETAHVCTLFAAPTVSLTPGSAPFALFAPNGSPLPLELGRDGLPLWNLLPDKDCILWTSGGVTTPMLRTLAQRGSPITVVTPDATHFLFDRTAAQLFARHGGRLGVTRRLTVAAVCANPWSAYGTHLDRTQLLHALRTKIDLPVVDVKEDQP